MTQGSELQDLSRLPLKLKQLIRVVAILLILLIPTVYGFILYQFQSEKLQYAADQISDAVSRFAYIYPDVWDLHATRYEHVIAGLQPKDIANHIQIIDTQNRVLVSVDKPVQWLPISGKSFIQGREGPVGTVLVSASFVNSLYAVLTTGLAAIIFLSGCFYVISRYAIKGLERTIRQNQDMQTSLRKEQLFLKGILSSSQELAIIATDQNWVILYLNATARAMFESRSKFTGCRLAEIEDQLQNNIENFTQTINLNERQKEYNFTFLMPKAGGSRHVHGRLYRILDQNAELYGYTLVCADITEQQIATELIHYQAMYDSLTNLPNRRLLINLLEQALASAKRHGHRGTVLFLDLDNFKIINDSLGHATGDQVLQEAARRMTTHVRGEDVVARLGGDEFVVLVNRIGKSSDEAIAHAQELASKLSETLSMPFTIGAHNLHVTSSVGITLFLGNDEDAVSIIQQADTAMYQAKHAGRNTVKFFLPSMQQNSEQRLHLINNLRKGLSLSEFTPYFQAQLNAEQRITGAETLIRWPHPERGMIMPNDFIPVAEDSGLIIQIGEYILESTFRIVQEWQSSNLISPDFEISINVSPQQFQQSLFARMIEQWLEKFDINPACLILEITERVFLKNFQSTLKKIEALKKIGVRLAIDDFGTGYSSLAYLKNLPVDEVKIDREFIRDVLVDDSDAALVEAVLMLAARLNFQAVAEGVENEEQFVFLKNMKCDKYQGNLFCEPLSKNEFESFCKSHEPIPEQTLS